MKKMEILLKAAYNFELVYDDKISGKGPKKLKSSVHTQEKSKMISVKDVMAFIFKWAELLAIKK